MPWILDGNNLARGRERGRVRTAALELARSQRLSIVVFFDGAPPEGGAAVEKLGRVEVRYVLNADNSILALIGGGKPGWRLTTDDRALAGRARDAGAEVVDAASFWRKVADLKNDGGGATRTPRGVEEELAFYRDSARPAADDVPQRVRRRKRPPGRDSR